MTAPPADGPGNGRRVQLVVVDPRLGPPGPPWMPEVAYRHDDAGPWWPGVLHAWRLDGATGQWRALVTFTRPNRLAYYQWVPGRFVRPAPEDADTP